MKIRLFIKQSERERGMEWLTDFQSVLMFDDDVPLQPSDKNIQWVLLALAGDK